MKARTDHIVKIKRDALRVQQLVIMSLGVSIAFLISIGFSELFELGEKMVLIFAGALWLIISIFTHYYSDKLFNELPV